jgi:hypothetical protein
MPCPAIPLADLRATDLRDFVFELVHPGVVLTNNEIYAAVLDRFGAGVCMPEVLCGNDPEPFRPEFYHTIRWVLEDAKGAGDLETVARGHWRRVVQELA